MKKAFAFLTEPWSMTSTKNTLALTSGHPFLAKRTFITLKGNKMLRISKLFTVLFAAFLLVVSSVSMANSSRGGQKQVFGQYEVHYIGLTSNFLSPETAVAYGIERSRTMCFISISVLDTKDNKDVGTFITAKVEGTIKNLIGQSRVLEFKEIKETDAVYYVSTFRFDRSEEHTSELQSRPHLVCRLLLEKKKV